MCPVLLDSHEYSYIRDYEFFKHSQASCYIFVFSFFLSDTMTFQQGRKIGWSANPSIPVCFAYFSLKTHELSCWCVYLFSFSWYVQSHKALITVKPEINPSLLVLEKAVVWSVLVEIRRTLFFKCKFCKSLEISMSDYGLRGGIFFFFF